MGYRSFYDGTVSVEPPVSEDEANAIEGFTEGRSGPGWYEGPVLELPTMPLGSRGFSEGSGDWVAGEEGLAVPETGDGYKYDQTEGLKHICGWLASRGHVCSGQVYVNADGNDELWMIEVKDSIVSTRWGETVYGEPEPV